MSMNHPNKNKDTADTSNDNQVSDRVVNGCMILFMFIVFVFVVLAIRDLTRQSQRNSDREYQRNKEYAEYKQQHAKAEQRRQSAMLHTYYIAYHSETYGEQLLLGADTKQACVDSLLKDHANRKPVAACNSDTTEIKIYHGDHCARYTVHLTGHK